MAMYGVRWCPHCKGILEAGMLGPDPFSMGPREVGYCPKCMGEIVLSCEWPAMSWEVKFNQLFRMASHTLFAAALGWGFGLMLSRREPWAQYVLPFAFGALVALIHQRRVARSVARYALELSERGPQPGQPPPAGS